MAAVLIIVLVICWT